MATLLDSIWAASGQSPACLVYSCVSGASSNAWQAGLKKYFLNKWLGLSSQVTWTVVLIIKLVFSGK